MPGLFNKIKRISSRVNPFSHSNTLTKIINYKTLYDLESSYCILPNSRTRIFFDLVHICFIIYNTFALPFYIGFAIELDVVIIVLEMSYISANLLHIVVELKTSQYIDGILTTDCTLLMKNYAKTGMIFLDIFCILPLNLALTGTYNIYTSIIRITRVCQSFYLNFYLKSLESKNRAFSPIIGVFKSFLILACIWHWSSCFWSWVNECVEEDISQGTWYYDNELENSSLAYRYAMSLYFSMNIATTAAFPEQYPQNNTERIFFIVMIYVGDACFATAFAIISNNTAVFPLKFNEIFKSINRIKLMLQESKISNHVLKRMEEYYTFLINLRQQDQASLVSIKSYITPHMFKELGYMKAKPFLVNFPIFSELKSPMMLREIAEKLEYAMYLPRDYIVCRNDIGEEMYFIIEGNVLVLTPREDSVIAVLKKGNYFGEIALFTQASRRICSVVSGSFCELFVLNKQFLNKILDGHPRIKETFQKESERRMEEYRRQSLANKSLNLKEKTNITVNKAKSKLAMMGKSRTVRDIKKKPQNIDDSINDKIEENKIALELKKPVVFLEPIPMPTLALPMPKSIGIVMPMPTIEEFPLPFGKKSGILMKNSNLKIEIKKPDDLSEPTNEMEMTNINLLNFPLKQPSIPFLNLKKEVDFLTPEKNASPLSISKLSPSQISDASDNDSIVKSPRKSQFMKSNLNILDNFDSDEGFFIIN